MRLTRVTKEEASRIPSIIAEVSERDWEGNVILHADSRLGEGDYGSYRFRLDVKSNKGKGSRRSASWSNSERRVKAACWHVHRDMLRAIFEALPHARIKTLHADYDGREGFEKRYPATGRVNVGALVYPVTYPELCECWEGNSDTWREEA